MLATTALVLGVLASPVEARRCALPSLPPDTPRARTPIRYTPDCVAFVRTPGKYTKRLDGYPWKSKYVKVDGLKMAYLDLGPADGQVVLLLHGQPAWSYLYRRMIPPLVAAGFRVIAPDLIGMGRSDKPVEFASYSYLRHVRWMNLFLDTVKRERRRSAPPGLQNVTAFVQDWGSLIGLRVIGDRPERFARVVVANGWLPVIATPTQFITLPSPPFLNPSVPFPFSMGGCAFGDWSCFEGWATYAMTSPDFNPGEIVEVATRVELSDAEEAAYDAPYPKLIYRAGPRVFPSLVNTLGEAPGGLGARAAFDAFDKPLLTLFGRADTLLGSDVVQALMRDTVPGAAGQPHHAYADANHFIQEDEGADLAQRVVAFINANPLP